MSPLAATAPASSDVPQWGPFLGVAAVLTVLILVLAHLSQRAVRTADSSTEIGPQHTPSTRLGEPVVGSTGRAPAGLSDEPTIEGVELTTSALLANVSVTQGAVTAILVGAAWFFAIPAWAFGVTATPASTGLPAIALGTGFGVVLWLGNELSTKLADAVGAAYDERMRELLAPDSTAGWVILLGVVLPIIAAAEELLFRAALIGVPAAGVGVSPWLLAVVSSLAFALGHGAQGRVGIVVTGALGFVLAAGYIVSGSLLVVIVAHYVVNALEFVVHELFDWQPGRILAD